MTSDILKSFNDRYKRLLGKYAGKNITRENINGYIDHTLLKPEATEEDIGNLCKEAKQYGFKAVCVNPYYVKSAFKELSMTNVDIAAVVGFPLGATRGVNKAFEAEKAVKDGATEIDMVINIGALKDGNYSVIEREIKEVVSVGALTKVIIEICLLSDEEKIVATGIVKDSGAAFVKTSTGFTKSGATLRDVALLKIVAGEDLKVKAAGGIRDFDTAQAMIFAGADRIGASRSVSIVSGK